LSRLWSALLVTGVLDLQTLWERVYSYKRKKKKKKITVPSEKKKNF